jgi:hypothetical protein
MRHRFHAICPYFAMFPEDFVKRHLVWSEPGQWVFDPFCGRGTTNFESLLNDRRSAGCDTNPVAVCISTAKCNPPPKIDLLRRLEQLADEFLAGPFEDLPEFFNHCFHTKTLEYLLYLKSALKWETDPRDAFLAALILGCLHGESHRSERYFSNRMPRTISTKPDYSVRWWQQHQLQAPERDVFRILHSEVDYRYQSPAPELTAPIRRGDARKASALFPELKSAVKLVITSPPYLDTTSFLEDQWLRLWFLGGPLRPRKDPESDDRHTSAERYWRFLEEAWLGLRDLLAPGARLIVRIGGAKLSVEEISLGLARTLRLGLDREVAAIEQRSSEIIKGQVRSFKSKQTGKSLEHDFHYLVD